MYSRALRLLFGVQGKAWLVTEEIANVFIALYPRLAGLEVNGSEIDARIEQAAELRGRQSEPITAGAKGVAVIPIRGVISHRAAMANDVSSSPGTSVEQIRAAFRKAQSDPRVTSIVLDIDSPGGSYEGLPELAAEIREARGRGRKRIVAVSNASTASGAYFLGAQADRVYSTPSGSVGSIGAYLLHVDESEALEREGVKPQFIYSGEHKVEGNPYEPLSDGARAHLQKRIDEVHADFVRNVAQGRGTSERNVRDNFGRGRMLSAPDALAAGMIDGIATADQVIESLLGGRPLAGRGSRVLGWAVSDEKFDEAARAAFGSFIRDEAESDKVSIESCQTGDRITFERSEIEPRFDVQFVDGSSGEFFETAFEVPIFETAERDDMREHGAELFSQWLDGVDLMKPEPVGFDRPAAHFAAVDPASPDGARTVVTERAEDGWISVSVDLPPLEKSSALDTKIRRARLELELDELGDA